MTHDPTAGSGAVGEGTGHRRQPSCASVDGEAPCVRSQLRLSQLRLSQLRLTQPLPLWSLLVVWWASTAPPLPPAADPVRGAQVRGEGGRGRAGARGFEGRRRAAGRPQRHVRFVGRNADRLFPTNAGGQSCTGKMEATCGAPQLRGTAEKRTAQMTQIRCRS